MTNVSSHDLLVPGKSWIVPITEEASSDCAVRTVAADDIVRRSFLLPTTRGVDLNPRLPVILSDLDDFVPVPDGSGGLRNDSSLKNLAESMKWKTDHAIFVFGGIFPSRRGSRIADRAKASLVLIKLPPGHAIREESLGLDFFEDASAIELVTRFGGIVGCTRVGVKGICHFQEFDLNVGSGEQEGKKQTRGSCTNNDYFGDGHVVRKE